MRDFILWMQRQDLSDKTIRQYSRWVVGFDDWLTEHGRPRARQATWKDVRGFALQTRETYPTRSGLRNSLTAFYRACGKRDGGPAWAVPCPKRKRGTYRGLDTTEEKQQLLDAARTLGAEPYAACCALYYQGLRREEAARLRWDEIRDDTIRGIGKGRVAFELPLHPKLAEALKNLTPSGPWIFEGRWPGTHVSPATVWMWVRLAAERGLSRKVTPHQLRHTSIAIVNDTVGLREASEFARHRDIQTTMIYTRTKRQQLLAGMAAL